MVSNMASNVATLAAKYIATMSQSTQMQQGKQRRPCKTNWSDTNNGADRKLDLIRSKFHGLPVKEGLLYSGGLAV